MLVVSVVLVMARSIRVFMFFVRCTPFFSALEELEKLLHCFFDKGKSYVCISYLCSRMRLDSVSDRFDTLGTLYTNIWKVILIKFQKVKWHASCHRCVHINRDLRGRVTSKVVVRLTLFAWFFLCNLRVIVRTVQFPLQIVRTLAHNEILDIWAVKKLWGVPLKWLVKTACIGLVECLVWHLAGRGKGVLGLFVFERYDPMIWRSIFMTTVARFCLPVALLYSIAVVKGAACVVYREFSRCSALIAWVLNGLNFLFLCARCHCGTLSSFTSSSGQFCRVLLVTIIFAKRWASAPCFSARRLSLVLLVVVLAELRLFADKQVRDVVEWSLKLAAAITLLRTDHCMAVFTII